MIKKVLLSLLLVGVVGVADVVAMKRTISAPAKCMYKEQSKERPKKRRKYALDLKVVESKQSSSKKSFEKKEACENKAARSTSGEPEAIHQSELERAVFSDDIEKFRELIGRNTQINSAITVAHGVSSTLLHAVVYAYTLKGTKYFSRKPVYCKDAAEDEEKLITWFMLLNHFNVNFSAKDGKGRTAAELALEKASSSVWRSRAMAPEIVAFIAVLKKIPQLMDEASDRFMNLMIKQRSDNELREYFKLTRI